MATLKQYPGIVPQWFHRYIYSYNDFKYTTAEQAAFYRIFKSSFLKGEYFDVEGNTNYFFILLFDLLNDFADQKDLDRVEEQMTTLATYYPRTRVYAIPFLIKRLEEMRLWTASVEVRGRHLQNNQGSHGFEGNYWGLGARYKTKLNLDASDTALLDTLYYSSNNFFEIEFCALQILKLFLNAVKRLRAAYEAEATDLDTQYAALTDVILRKHYRYHTNSWNYKNGHVSARNDIYLMLLKHCENTIREHYGHKRKLNIEFSELLEVKQQLENRVFSKINNCMPELLSEVEVLDEKTDVELYAQNTGRWKIVFEALTNNFTDADGKAFTEKIIVLGELNRRNPSVENIFYEASKFIAKKDKAAALNLYVRYLHYDLKSFTFDNKPLTKTIQKSLFATPEQMRDFELVVAGLIRTKDLDQALSAISGFYEVRRKKIQLDKASIEQVNMRHAGTVELLNEYLAEEPEMGAASVSMRTMNTDEVAIDIKPEHRATQSIFIAELLLTPAQVEALEKFAKASFVLSASDLDLFAREKGLFTSGLVDGINEACYEHLDDILINAEEEDFVINQNYYQRILAA
jgi:hypothetical protein